MLMAGASMAVPVTATVTASNRPPTRRATSTVAVGTLARSTARANCSKPGSVNVRVYAPSGSAANAYCPVPSVTRTTGPPTSAGAAAVMVTPGRTPPVASVTVPTMRPSLRDGGARHRQQARHDRCDLHRLLKTRRDGWQSGGRSARSQRRHLPISEAPHDPGVSCFVNVSTDTARRDSVRHVERAHVRLVMRPWYLSASQPTCKTEIFYPMD